MAAKNKQEVKERLLEEHNKIAKYNLEKAI